MADRALVELTKYVTLRRRIQAAVDWHDGMGEHRWCAACDLVAILRGETP